MNGIGLSIQEDLEGHFYKAPFIDEYGKDSWLPADTIGEAEGLFFLCPVCFASNGNTHIGTHRVMCWSPNVSQDFKPNPGRWGLVGTGIGDVSLVAGSSSVAIQGGCGAHFFVTNGRIAKGKLGD